MKNSLQLHVKPTDQDITRAQSIFTTIMNIVNREVSFQHDHNVFVLGFGFEDVATCDLLALLEYVQTFELQTHGNSHENLLQLLTSLGASNFDQYIRKHVSEREAQFLFNFYSGNRDELREFVKQFSFSISDCRIWGNGQEALIRLLTSNGASIAKEYVRKHMPEEQAGFLFKFYSRNHEELLELVEQFVFSTEDHSRYDDGQAALVKLLASNGAPSTEKYVRKYVSEDQAQFLFKFYSRNIIDLRKVVGDLPAVCKKKSATGFNVALQVGFHMKNLGSNFGICDDGDTTEKKAAEEQVKRAIEHAYGPATTHIADLVNIHVNVHVDRSMRDLKLLLRQSIVKRLRTMERPESKTFQSTVNLLKQVTHTSLDSSTTQQSLTSAQLSALADSIEPFIYGGTPMCEAL
jgi:hypothetical protein